MKPFNLAESRILERTYCQKHINKRLRMICLMALLTLIVAGASFTCKSMFAGEVRRTELRLSDTQGSRAKMKTEMSRINVKLSERKWQEQLAGQSGKCLGIMDAAAGSVPSDVWLDSIKNSSKDSSVAIAGRAASFDSVTAYIERLRSHRAFAEVRLDSAKLTGKSNQTCVDFILSVTLPDSEGSSDSSGTASPPATTPAPVPAPATTQSAPSTRGRVPQLEGST